MKFEIVDDNIIMWDVNKQRHIAYIPDEIERLFLKHLLNSVYYSGELNNSDRGVLHGFIMNSTTKRRSTRMLDSFGNEIFDGAILEISQAKGLAFVFWKKDWKMWLERSLEDNYYMGGGVLATYIYPTMRTKVVGNIYNPECREIVAKAWMKYLPPEAFWRPEGSYKVSTGTITVSGSMEGFVEIGPEAGLGKFK